MAFPIESVHRPYNSAAQTVTMHSGTVHAPKPVILLWIENQMADSNLVDVISNIGIEISMLDSLSNVLCCFWLIFPCACACAFLSYYAFLAEVLVLDFESQTPISYSSYSSLILTMVLYGFVFEIWAWDRQKIDKRLYCLKMIGKGFVLFKITSSPSAFYIIKPTCIS